MMIQANFLEQPFYVGLQIAIIDETKLVIYVSKEPTQTQTDQHMHDYRETQKIKHLIDQIVRKYRKDIRNRKIL